MAKLPALSSPVYQFPVSDDDLILVGRVAAMWGHLDTNVDAILMKLYGMGFTQFDNIFGGKLAGPKCDSIVAAIDRASGEASKKALRIMVEAVKGCIHDRNTIYHGLWGWEWKKGEWIALAFSRSKNASFYFSGLRVFHERVADACVKADAALMTELGVDPLPTSRNRPFKVYSDENLGQLPALPQGFER